MNAGRIRPISFGGRFTDYDYIEEDSDQEGGRDSSDDEIEMILHGTPEQKRKLSRSLSQGSLELSSSSEDDFEKEMEQELEESMRQHGVQSSSNSGNAANGGPSQPQSEFYDDIYFDSDEEETAQSGHSSGKKQKTKRRIPTNEELFYDPDIDDDNQKWVDKQRSFYHTSKNNTKETDSNRASQTKVTPTRKKGPGPKIPKSDAILNCPACMTTLCLDCQRHELYPTQYRAMFVLNCEIVHSERLRYTLPKQKGKKWRQRKRRKQERDALSHMSSNSMADVRGLFVKEDVSLTGDEKIEVLGDERTKGDENTGGSECNTHQMVVDGVKEKGHVGGNSKIDKEGSAEVTNGTENLSALGNLSKDDSRKFGENRTQITPGIHDNVIDGTHSTSSAASGGVGNGQQAVSEGERTGQVLSLAEDEMVEFYHPVRCSVCSTEVAVYDKDEVFHFFNVLTSAS